MNRILILCLLVLVVIGNTSEGWTKKSEEVPKDLKDEKENMKEVLAHWQENISNKKYTTTTSTSTMPPTTSSSTMPRTITEELIELLKHGMNIIKDEMKEIKEEMKKIKEEVRKERKAELEKNNQDSTNEILCFCKYLQYLGIIPKKINCMGIKNSAVCSTSFRSKANPWNSPPKICPRKKAHGHKPTAKSSPNLKAHRQKPTKTKNQRP